MTTTSSNLRSKYQLAANEYQNTNAVSWAQETFELGMQAYSDISMNEPVAEDYIAKNKAFAEKQLVLGGERLAYLLT